MKEVTVNFDKELGNVKIMNAVNNGPAGSKVRGTGNYAAYEALNNPLCEKS